MFMMMVTDFSDVHLPLLNYKVRRLSSMASIPWDKGPIVGKEMEKRGRTWDV